MLPRDGAINSRRSHCCPGETSASGSAWEDSRLALIAQIREPIILLPIDDTFVRLHNGHGTGDVSCPHDAVVTLHQGGLFPAPRAGYARLIGHRVKDTFWRRWAARAIVPLLVERMLHVLAAVSLLGNILLRDDSSS